MVSAHGHGFHYAVMRRAQALENQGLSYWVFEAAEFPVTAGSVVTHVDFILRARRGATHLVA